MIGGAGCSAEDAQSMSCRALSRLARSDTREPAKTAAHKVAHRGRPTSWHRIPLRSIGHRHDKGAIVLREKVARDRITVRLANVPQCLIGIEAAWRRTMWLAS